MAIPDNQFSSSPIIIYDGVCHLCNSGVNFILKRDRKKIFRFTPFQSLFAKNLLKENGESEHVGDTFILIHEGKIFNRADAALKITMLLGENGNCFIRFTSFRNLFAMEFIISLHAIVTNGLARKNRA